MNPVRELADQWREAGIAKGDTVLLHSNLTHTVRQYLRKGVKIDAQTIYDSFCRAVGHDGTFLLPLFNFEFTKGVPFDIRSTQSEMGALTEIGRQRAGAIRTGHPIYSFAAVGAQAERFANVDNKSGYGPDSPFGILRDLEGKIAILNLPDQHSMTNYHYIEEMLEVPYRYHKHFAGKYTDAEGNTTERTYSLFVRDIEKGVLTHVDPAGELMWEAGLYNGFRPNDGCGLRVVAAAPMFDFVAEIINSGRAEGLLYRIESPATR